jgi:hypothetical protein
MYSSVAMTERKRATLATEQDCPQEFLDLLVETLEQSSFIETYEDSAGVHIYEQGPFRDVALDNLPFGPISSDGRVNGDDGVYAECHIIDNREDVDYAGVWYHDQNHDFHGTQKEFVLKIGQGKSSETVELSEGQAKHIVKEHGGWNYVE